MTEQCWAAHSAAYWAGTKEASLVARLAVYWAALTEQSWAVHLAAYWAGTKEASTAAHLAGC